MAHRILILGASYGSLFATKCLMAGHDVTLVCRGATAELINTRGTEVRIRLKGEDTHRAIRSAALPGRLDADVPEDVDPAGYDMVVLAMQEPQYLHHTIRMLLTRIAAARLACLSLMNMPPLAYLRRIAAIDADVAEAAYSKAGVWDRFDPQLVTLCSPDPQAARPADEPPVSEIKPMVSSAQSRAPTSGPPGTTFSIPGGSPALTAREPSTRDENGATSDGLSTTAFPAASAGATFRAVAITGPFQGMMAATTP